MIKRTTASRVLWLSDIHVWERYKKMQVQYQKELPRYFDAFFKTIESEPVFDYIILSGDIAFAGEEADYLFFKDLFFSRLEMSKHSRAKLLVVPGNHDICRANSENLVFALSNNGRETYKSRNEYLNSNNQNNFLRNFEPFTSFFNSADIVGHFPKKGLNSTYNNHKLFGFHVDSEKKIVFILLNSAWFSLGNNFNTLLTRQVLQELKALFGVYHLRSSKLNKVLKDILETKDNIAEYGSQVIGCTLLEELDLLASVFHRFSDFTVFTIMHHPPNWLHWLERYDYDENEFQTKALQIILSCSNFLLTGHEHVPSTRSNEFLDNSTHHLKAGCFLDELKANTSFFDLTHNRFSILEIYNGNNNWLIEKVFQYQPTTLHHEIVHRWIAGRTNKEPIFYNFKHASLEYNSIDSDFCLERYLDERIGDLLEEVESVKGEYSIYKARSKYYIVSKKGQAISRIINIDFVNRILKRADASKNRIAIHFILKDTHCNEDLYSCIQNLEDFMEIRSRRDALFEAFKSEYQMRLDVFRNLLFKSLEAGSMSLKEIMNISLNFEILPYWYFESLCEPLETNNL